MDEIIKSLMDGAKTALNDRIQRSSGGRPFRDPAAILAINGQGHFLHDRSGSDFDWSFISRETLAPLVSAIRKDMPDLAWPVLIGVEASGMAESHYPSLRVTAVGMANKMPRDGRHTHAWDDRNGATFLALSISEIRNASLRMEGMLPPTNREVRSWSSISAVSGTEFCHNENIHARTEAEFLLKMLWLMQGAKGLDQIGSGDKTSLKWLLKSRFVSEELTELEIDPRGRRANAAGVIDQIAEFLQIQAEAPLPFE